MKKRNAGLAVVAAVLAGSLLVYVSGFDAIGNSASDYSQQSMDDAEFADVSSSAIGESYRRELDSTIKSADFANAITLIVRKRVDLSKYPEDYEQLRNRVEDGDPWAGFVMASWLRACRSSPPSRTREDHLAAIDRFQQTHFVESYHDGISKSTYLDTVVGTQDTAKSIIESMNRVYEHCNGVSSQRRLEAEKWIDIVISHDRNPNFLLEKTRYLDDRSSEPLYRDIWESGDAGALLHLYRTKKSGFDIGESDMSQSEIYAYFIAWSEIQRAQKLRSGQDPQIINQVFDRYIANAESKLYEYDVSRSRQRALDLIRQNKNCCVVTE